MITGFLEVSPTPKTNYFYLWRHQDTEKKIKEIPGAFQIYIIFINLRILEIQYVGTFGKGGRRQIIEIPLKTS